MPKTINIKKLIKRGVLLALLASILGLFVFNELVKRYGYTGTLDFVSNYAQNKRLATVASPLFMEIEMSDADYAFLEKKRQEALDRGVQINDGENYVACKIIAEEKTIDAEIRLKGHMTDHLQGDKWSFRIKSEQKIFGMYRFSLQHPGTRNYAYEWVYHQLLKEEGVIHLNYDFIHVKLRDNDLGIYAIEEHFGQHVLDHNNRPEGAILRWNPNLYWEWRIDELDGVYLDEQYSAYTSSFAEPYDRGTVKADPKLLETYGKGASLLEAFRRGEKTTSEVFDVELMAKFHAIIDLVGGYHSLDWSDVKFFYNSETQKIEPVGYESFSVRKTERIAGQRIPDQYDEVNQNYHDRLFSEQIFYRDYIEHLQRICDEKYFNRFIENIKPEHDKKLAILATEWPHRKFTFDPYFENIRLIRHNLELPKPFHAFVENAVNDTTLALSISPVSDFPIEIMAVEIDGKEKVPVKDFILPPKARNSFARYFDLKVIHHAKKLKNVQIKARIPGGTKIFTIDAEDYPSYQSAAFDCLSQLKSTELTQHPQLRFHQKDQVYFFDTTTVLITENYQLEDATLRLLPDQKIIFANGSIQMTNARLEAYGAGDHEVTLEGSQDFAFFDLVNTSSILTFTQILGGQTGFRSVHSEVAFDHCVMAGFSENFIEALESEISITNSFWGKLGCLGSFDRSYLNLKNVVAKNGQKLLHADGSNIKIRDADLKGFEKLFELDHISKLTMWGSSCDDNKLIAELKGSSEFSVLGGDLGRADLGFIVEEKDGFGGKSVLSVYRTETKGILKMQ